jgi:hypothetical protein
MVCVVIEGLFAAQGLGLFSFNKKTRLLSRARFNIPEALPR